VRDERPLYPPRVLRTTILEQIGGTPLLRARSVTEGLKNDVEIYAKLEMFNPGGSVKDRPALRMIEDGERSGRLVKGKTIIDSTSGKTGIAYAMIGAVKGYPVELVMPGNVSRERKAIVGAFGAKIILTDPMEGSDGAILECRRIYEANPEKYFKPDQYNNPSNWKAHYDTTGPEIWNQTGGAITHLVASIGTSGTLVGTSRRLKEYNPNICVVAAEPYPFHGIEGLKHMATSIIPGIYDERAFDEKVNVETEDAYEMTRRLAREEGVMVGQSSGAAMVAALEIARRLHEGVIVVIFPDGGGKYLSTRVWEWNWSKDDYARKGSAGPHL
jgi:cysteine synthase B